MIELIASELFCSPRASLEPRLGINAKRYERAAETDGARPGLAERNLTTEICSSSFPFLNNNHSHPNPPQSCHLPRSSIALSSPSTCLPLPCCHPSYPQWPVSPRSEPLPAQLSAPTSSCSFPAISAPCLVSHMFAAWEAWNKLAEPSSCLRALTVGLEQVSPEPMPRRLSKL